MKLFHVFKNHSFKNKEIFSLLRIACGLHLLFYHFFVILPGFNIFFGENSMVSPQLFSYYPHSPLFMIWSNDYLKLGLLFLLIILCLFFTIGLWARIVHIPLYLLNLSFHLANPFIIHEPQQLVNLLLFVLFFLPYETFSIKKSYIFRFLEKMSERYSCFALTAIQVYLGCYYFFAGIKKLPDLPWLEGTAISLLASWPPFAKENLITDLFQIEFISMMGCYFTLIFEIGFIFISFSRWRRFLIPIGIMFHALIGIAFDVGLFFPAMIMWYSVLLRDITWKFNKV